MEARELDPVGEAEAIRGPHDHVLVHFEILGQDVENAPRHAGFDLEQRERSIAQLAQASVDGFQQIVRFVFFDHHVGVADDAEQVCALHLRAREQLVDVGANDVLDEGERLTRLVGRHRAADPLGQQHETRQRDRAP